MILQEMKIGRKSDVRQFRAKAFDYELDYFLNFTPLGPNYFI